MVMLICIKTANSVLLLESFLFQHVKNLQLIRDLVVSHNETLIYAHWLVQLKPGVFADVFNFETLFWVRIQNPV